jgi:hypothetical protein
MFRNRVAALVLPALAWTAASSAQTAPSNLPATSTGPFVRMVRHNDGSRSVTARDAGKTEQEVLTYDSEGELKLRRIYQLDRYGKATTFIIQDGSGRPVLRGEFAYDSRDRMTEERLYGVPGNQLIRRLNQDYEPTTGKKLKPRIQSHSPLPEELLYWMDPDSAQPGALEAAMKAAQAKGGPAAPAPAPEKKGIFRGILKRGK